MGFLHKHNSDNIHSRAIIVGLINLLNNKIQIYNTLSNNKVDVIDVPWFFAKSIDERFLQDYFTFWSDCTDKKYALGNYDVNPRGIITLESKSINTSNLTNRFVRGTYIKEIDGKLETFNSYINSLPLTMSFSCTIKCPSYTDAFKIEDSIFQTFYKTNVFNVNYKGFRLPCQVGFPDDMSIDKNLEYSYSDENETILTFSLELETYFPVIDETNERHESNRIQSYSSEVNFIDECGNVLKENKSIKIVKPEITDEYIHKDLELLIEYNTIGSIHRVKIEYSDDSKSTWNLIEKYVKNTGKYNWNIYNNIEQRHYIILDEETNDPAILLPIIDSDGKLIDINIIYSGNGYTGNTENIINGTVEEINGNGKAEIKMKINNGKITDYVKIPEDEDLNKSNFTQVIKTYSIRISDNHNSDIYDIIDNINIL